MDKILKELNALTIDKKYRKEYVKDEGNYTMRELEKNETVEDPYDVVTVFEIPERDAVIIIGELWGFASELSDRILYLSFHLKEYLYAYVIRKSTYRKNEEKIKEWLYFTIS